MPHGERIAKPAEWDTPRSRFLLPRVPPGGHDERTYTCCVGRFPPRGSWLHRNRATRLGANATRPRFDVGSGAPGVVSGRVGASSTALKLNIKARRVDDGKGVGTIRWSLSRFNIRIVERVTCVAITGNHAWANTIVVSSNNPSVSPAGQVHTWIFQDDPDALQAEFVFVDCSTEPPVTAFTPDNFFRLLDQGDLTISSGT